MTLYRIRHLLVKKLFKTDWVYLTFWIALFFARYLPLLRIIDHRRSLASERLIDRNLAAKYLENIIMSRSIKRLQVGGLPLINHIAERMGLRDILYQYIPSHGNEDAPAVESLMLLIFNLTLGKAPLYQLEQWVQSIDLRCLGMEQYRGVKFTDDRFGRALDKNYRSDRASQMTDIVINTVNAFSIKLERIHNDSTSVKAFGKIAGKTKSGLELKHGISKDHRPDLKQLVFSLSISSDGGVPVHHKCYCGDRTDDTTHIETWNTVCRIVSKPSFLYVGDSKLCSDEQLSHIDQNGGRAITIIPESWAEVAAFKQVLREKRKAKEVIWRRRKPGSQKEQEYFSAFTGDFFTTKRGYRIHWIYSSEKRKRDLEKREKRLKKTEQSLAALNAKINRRLLKSRQAIESALKDILEQREVERFIDYEIGSAKESYRVQKGKGRPGKNTQYVTRQKTFYTLSWRRNRQSLKAEANTDGVFPLLCTDVSMSAKEILKAYKY